MSEMNTTVVNNQITYKNAIYDAFVLLYYITWLFQNFWSLSAKYI